MTDEHIRLEFTNLLDGAESDIRYMLDSSVLPNELPAGPEITGWVIHRKHKIAEVLLTSGNKILATSKLDIFRPLVSKHFTQYYNSESAGFKLIATTRPKRKFLLKIRLENGNTIAVAEFKLAIHDQQKLLFMHIAKAAGSSVNTFFSDHFTEGQYAIHIESNSNWQSKPDELKKLGFLSGHVGLYVLDKKLNLEDYYKVTVLREPFAQLSSHLAWIKRLSMSGEEQRLNKHAIPIQAFAKKLSEIDFSKPEKLRTLLDSLTEFEMRLIDNCQVRYFKWFAPGQSVSEADAQKAITATEVFDRIGLTESIYNFMKNVARDMSWAEPGKLVHENVTQDFYGLDLSNSETRATLWPLVKHDMTLYKHIKVSSTFDQEDFK